MRKSSYKDWMCVLIASFVMLSACENVALIIFSDIVFFISETFSSVNFAIHSCMPQIRN